MFDPTLYGATLPHRELPFIHPFFAQWQTQQLPWQAQQLPWQAQQLPWQHYQRFVPPAFQKDFLPKEFMPQDYFMMQPFYGQRAATPPVPPFMGFQHQPFYNRQFPFIY